METVSGSGWLVGWVGVRSLPRLVPPLPSSTSQCVRASACQCGPVPVRACSASSCVPVRALAFALPVDGIRVQRRRALGRIGVPVRVASSVRCARTIRGVHCASLRVQCYI
jgi:hypothetical protein